MASNLPDGAENDPNAPWRNNLDDYETCEICGQRKLIINMECPPDAPDTWFCIKCMKELSNQALNDTE